LQPSGSGISPLTIMAIWTASFGTPVHTSRIPRASFSILMATLSRALFSPTIRVTVSAAAASEICDRKVSVPWPLSAVA
jgi:hypothetical protein